MPLSLSLTLGQVLEITDEFEHISDLIKAEIQRRGGILEGEEAYDEVAFPIFEALCDYIRNEAGTLKGSEMKTVVHTWIDERLAEMED